MPKASIVDRLNAIEELVFRGDLPAALRELDAVHASRPGRSHMPRIANLYRRSEMPEKAVNLLHRYVRPPERSPRAATAPEIVEYAASLTNLGHVKESVALLSMPEAAAHPNHLLFRGYAYQRLRLPEKAARDFEKYVSVGRDGREIALGKIYRAGSIMMMRAPDLALARQLLDEALSMRELLGRVRLLHFDALFVKLQLEVRERSPVEARKLIDRIEELDLVGESPWRRLLVDKWSALLGLYLAPKAEQASRYADLRKVRDQLAGEKLFERARNCDLLAAEYMGNVRLLQYLYYGSPYETVRARLKARLVELGAEVPEYFDHRLERKSGAESVRLDVLTGELTPAPRARGASAPGLKAGMLTQRLLFTLASDFYKRPSLVELHQALHPGDVYHPTHTRNRIHQAVWGLRQWLERSRAPLVIDEEGGFYRLRSTESCTLRLPLSEVEREPEADGGELTARERHLLERLRERFAAAEFSMSDATEVLALNPRTIQRLLRDAAAEGAVTRSGAGRGVRYVFRSGSGSA